jgi:hypothetical protein
MNSANSNLNEIPLSVIEDSNHNYIIVGFTYDTLFEQSNGTIICLNSNGNIINQFSIGNEGENLKFGKILYSNNIYSIFGGIYNSNASHRNLLFCQYNEQWNEINRKFIYIPNDRNLGSYYPIQDSDSSFVISGVTTSVSDYFPNHFYIKINSVGDSTISIFKNSSFYPSSYTILESQNQLKYYDILISYQSSIFSGILQLDKNFDTIAFHYISIPLYYTYGSLVQNDSTLIIAGVQLYLNRILTLCLVNENGQVIDSLLFQKSNTMKEMPAFSQCLSKFENTLFLGATSNYDHLNPFYSQFDSWFHLIKLDTSLTVIWEKWYGGDAYYFLNSVLATSDGGCLLVGTKYPHGSPSLIRYSHFVKVDANGDVLWTQDIEMPELSYKVYPNPTQSVFNIENSELNIIQIELYDISGRYLTSISDCSTSTISIDLSPFSNGIYFAKIKSSKGVRTEKVVKN